MLMNWEKRWKDKDGLEPDLDSKCRNLPVGERKGFKKQIKRFVDEAAKFMCQVGNESCYNAAKECTKDTIKSLAGSWFKACNAYLRREDTAAWRHERGKEAAACEVIPAGPSSSWGTKVWETMQHRCGKWKRLQKRCKLTVAESLMMN